MNKSRIKVAVLGGGPSSEHEVSLRSAAKVLENLDKDKYEARPITIDRDGHWEFDGKLLVPSDGLEVLRLWKVDVVFIALHGAYGEDGTVQRLLDSAELRYTGSDAEASALSFNKPRSLEVFRANDIVTAQSQIITRQQWEASRVVNDSYPVIVKPAEGGSSVGTALVHQADELGAALASALAYSDEAVVEEYIKGREATCGVLDDGKAVALVPTEIRPKTAELFDYEAKYDPAATDEITPAEFSDEVNKQIQNIAVRAHKALGCYGMSRTDVIVTDSGIVTLETNTIPGLTETSLLPQGAAAMGINFSQLLDKIIGAALEKPAKHL
jgi:D-alanine-D-alanine ligase